LIYSTLAQQGTEQ